MNNELNIKEVDEILQKHGKGIISLCYPVIKAGSPVEEYGKVELMKEVPADDILSHVLAKKAAKKCSVILTKHDFSKGEDEPLYSRAVFFCECHSTKEIELFIGSLKDAEYYFNSYINKLLEFATR